MCDLELESVTDALVVVIKVNATSILKIEQNDLRGVYMNNSKKLLKLVQENPGLLIIPMVNGEVCGNEGNYWQGSFGRVEVNEFVCRNGRFYTRNEQDVLEDELSNSLCDDYPDMSDEEFFKMIHEKVESLPWKKAIIVCIELPEVK